MSVPCHGENELVSVVIPAYNAQKHIEETLKSVFGQTYAPLEVIIVDDGSTDTTASIIKIKFPAVRYFYKSNGGVASARNLGIRMAKGRYIAFIDADDAWHPDKISKQVYWLKEHPDTKWCYCDCAHFRDTPENLLYKLSSLARPFEGEVLQNLFLRNFIASPTPLLRREVFDAVGLFSENKNINTVEDYDMWIRIAEHYPVGYLGEALAFYRQYSETSHVEIGGVYNYLRANLHVLAGSVRREPEKLLPLYSFARSSIYLRLGIKYIRERFVKEGRKMLLKAAKLNPRNWSAYSAYLISFMPAFIVNGMNKMRHYSHKI